MHSTDLTDFLLQPALWWFLLAVWVVVWFRERSAPPVASKFNPKTARPGDLFADGSSATSNTEKRVRKVIEDAGYRLYPPSVRIYTPRDGNGKRHKYTPDILLKKPKMIVEVDPHFWHGDPDKIAHDIDRNRMYARLGYTIVRVRIAGTQALSPNDVVITTSDFDIVRDGPLLLKRIRRAKYLPPRVWEDSRKYVDAPQGTSKMTAQQQRDFQKQQVTQRDSRKPHWF